MQQQLKSVGIELEIKNYPGSLLFAHDGPIYTGKYDSEFTIETNGPDPDNEGLWSGEFLPPHGTNATFFDDPLVNRVSHEALLTYDRAKRKALYQQEEARIHQLVPAVFFYWQNSYSAVNADMKGWRAATYISSFWNCYEWRSESRADAAAGRAPRPPRAAARAGRDARARVVERRRAGGRDRARGAPQRRQRRRAAALRALVAAGAPLARRRRPQDPHRGRRRAQRRAVLGDRRHQHGLARRGGRLGPPPPDGARAPRRAGRAARRAGALADRARPSRVGRELVLADGADDAAALPRRRGRHREPSRAACSTRRTPGRATGRSTPPTPARAACAAWSRTCAGSTTSRRSSRPGCRSRSRSPGTSDELPGAPLAHSDGHLIVVRGFEPAQRAGERPRPPGGRDALRPRRARPRLPRPRRRRVPGRAARAHRRAGRARQRRRPGGIRAERRERASRRRRTRGRAAAGPARRARRGARCAAARRARRAGDSAATPATSRGCARRPAARCTSSSRSASGSATASSSARGSTTGTRWASWSTLRSTRFCAAFAPERLWLLSTRADAHLRAGAVRARRRAGVRQGDRRPAASAARRAPRARAAHPDAARRGALDQPLDRGRRGGLRGAGTAGFPRPDADRADRRAGCRTRSRAGPCRAGPEGRPRR